MPWVSNLTSGDITVTISSNTGGYDSDYKIAADAIESKGANWWNRKGNETVKVALANGKHVNTTIGPNQHLHVYDNAIELTEGKFIFF
ncbi:hypothetical protein AX16_010905 [Volvariella volvacea WC 439]|nr:hypothetical protein AX16_010905 [Volvariella volvacea WC 439]